MADLEAAIAKARLDVNSTTETHPDRLKRLNNLGNLLSESFSRTKALPDLEEAIQSFRRALDATTKDHPDRAAATYNLAVQLGIRFKTTQIKINLEEAIQLCRQAVDTTLEKNPERFRYLDELGILLGKRYSLNGALRDLEEAVQVHRQATNAVVKSNRDRAVLLHNLAHSLSDKFSKTRDANDLRDAIITFQQAVSTALENSSNPAASLTCLAYCLSVKFSTTKVMADLQEAIETAQQAVDITLEGDSELPVRLNNLGSLFGFKFLETGDITDIEEAIRRSQQAVDATPKDDPGFPKRCNDVQFWLGQQPSQVEVIADFKEPTLVSGQAIDATTTAKMDIFKVDPEIVASFRDLEDEDLRSFVELLELSENNTNSEQDELYIYTCFLIYLQSRVIEFLHRAIHRTQTWVVSTATQGKDSTRRFEIFVMLIAEAVLLSGTEPEFVAKSTALEQLKDVFQQFASKDGMENNLSSVLNNVADFFTDNTQIALAFDIAASRKIESFEMTGEIDTLNTAISLHELALSTAPRPSPHRAGMSYNLALRLGRRAEMTGSLMDIDLAIQIATDAVESTSQTDPDHGLFLQGLGSIFRRRFELTGSIEDLDRAIEHCSMAVRCHPRRDVKWSSSLSALANALGRRFQMTGSLEDINSAVETANLNLEAGLGRQSLNLTNLCCWLFERSERTGSEEDLDRAIEVIAKAIDTTPEGHVERHRSLANLGRCLFIRFERSRSIEALNRSIEATAKAIDSAPEDHRERAYWQSNLGTALLRRFEQIGSRDDLERAIEVTNLAIEATPRTDSHRAALCLNLGELFRLRSVENESENDLKLCLASYMDGWNCHNGPPSHRIVLAKHACNILVSQADWQQSNSLLKAVVQLLPLISPRALKHSDKQYMLGRFAGLASDAAAVALNAGDAPMEALRLLEASRGIISSLLLDMRGDVTELEQQHPGLAAKFIALRDVLDSPAKEDVRSAFASDNIDAVSQTSLRRGAERDLSHVLAEIRAKPGFHDFLLPPSADELLSAASPDPIVIVNLSSIRSDAFAIYQSRIILIPLRDLHVVDVKDWVDRPHSTASPQIGQMLEWLWDTVCGPILEALNFKESPLGDDWPHFWWIPTSILSRLPLHAAGYHKLGLARSVLDRVMSSYASSVKASLRRRKRSIDTSPPLKEDCALVVAMRDTPGLSTNRILPFVTAELEMLTRIWSIGKTKLKLIRPTPRKGDVLKHLPLSKIFHFAGHGSSDPLEPSRSCLLLEDWQTDPLTVEDLRDRSFQDNPPFLGYLSACSTGANKVDHLIDEGIHLIGALQLAGFQNVVGTLWEVSDKHCVDVARVLYQTISEEGMTNMAVSRGLHRALIALRDLDICESKAKRDVVLDDEDDESRDSIDWFWIPYVHHGSF